MKDIETYIAKAGQPEFALTPDGFFPLSIGEKGALMWVVEGELDLEEFSLDGGIQCNVVAPSCTFSLPSESIPKVMEANRRHGFEIQINQAYDKSEVRVKGIASHASAPDQGHNAIVDALILLAEVTTHPTLEMLANAFKSPYGEGCDIAFEEEPMGKLTLNLGTLKIHEGKLSAQVDCRYPFGIDSNDLTRKLKNALPGLEVSLPYDAKPILNDIRSPYIQTVLKQYREWSHDLSEPVISGGVSYCKVIDHCIAFGPLSKDMEIMAHQKNESIEIDYIERLYPLYRDTMMALANQEENL
jgi:succinyl-diaminopimelate desuccinylase